MPRYYFHIKEGGQRAVDEVGMNLPSLDAAKHEAEISAREILADMLREGRALDGQLIEVADEQGTVLTTVPFKSVFWIGA